MIYPPNTLMLGDGADCDWPGPEYETVDRSVQDERHRISGATPLETALENEKCGRPLEYENPYW